MPKKQCVAMKNGSGSMKPAVGRIGSSSERGGFIAAKSRVTKPNSQSDGDQLPSILLAARLGAIYIATSSMEPGAPEADPSEVAKQIGVALNKDVRIGNVKLASPENSSTWSFTQFRDWKPE